MLTPTLSLQVADARYEHASRVRLRRGLLPIVDRLEVVLPAGTELAAAPGAEVTLDLDGGEGQATVFTGQLSAVTRGLRGLRLCAHGFALTLARARPAGAFEKLSVQEIFERITEGTAISLAIRGADMPTALFVCEGRSTALELVVRLCAMAGLQAAFDGEGTLQIGPDGPGEALALRHGRELLDASSAAWLPVADTFTVSGEGGGTPDSEQSLWIARDFAAGGGTPAATGVRWRSEALVRRVEDARAAAASWTAAQRRRETPIRLTTWLLPRVAPGSTIEVRDLPDAMQLPTCMVRQVVQEIDPALGGRSTIWASAADGGGSGLGGLLG